MALRIRLIKHLMAFSKKPILNRPRTLLSIYLPFGFFPWRRLVMHHFCCECDESTQQPCDLDLLDGSIESCNTIFVRFLRSVTIELLIIPLVPLYFLYDLLEVPRLGLKNFRTMKSHAQTPPELILVFLFEAVEAVPQLAIQTWLFFHKNVFVNPNVFWMSFTFSVIGILKALGTFVVNYNQIVAGIIRIPRGARILKVNHHDLRMLPIAFIGNPRIVHTIDLQYNKLDGVNSQVWKSFWKNFPNVRSIILNSNNIGDICTKYLAEALPIEQLVTISLKNNNIGDTGVKALVPVLSKGSCLVELNLEGNIIEDEGARCIAELCNQLPSLKIVNLRWNSIRSDGVTAFAEMLDNNITLRQLNLESNPSDNNDAWKKMANALTRRSTELMLKCSSNNISWKLEQKLHRVSKVF